MKQNVNLYQLQFQQARPTLAALRVAQIVGTFVLLLIAAHTYEYGRTQQLEQSLESLRAQRGAESTRVVELASLYPPKQVDARVEAEATRLVAERDAKTRLLQLLGSQSLGNTTGFSSQVAGLARQRVDGLWLRGVHIEQGGRVLSLSGSALEPDLVPRFLQALGQEEVFAGQSFQRLRIERAEDDTGRIDFDLSSNAEELQP